MLGGLPWPPARADDREPLPSDSPPLEPQEIARLRRFGEERAYAAGEPLIATGEASPGLFVILDGVGAIIQHSVLGYEEPIITRGPSSFMGELPQLPAGCRWWPRTP